MWISTAEVKTILGLTSSTYDTQIAALIPLVKSWVMSKLNNDFEVKRKYPVDYYDQRFNHKEVIYLFTNTISFDSVTKKITDSAGNFVNAGFRAGFDVKVQDSQYNDKVFSIDTVTATELTVSSVDTLVTEVNTYYTYLTLVQLPLGLKVPFSKIIDIELHKLNAESINVEQELSGVYPPEIMEQLRQWKRPVFI